MPEMRTSTSTSTLFASFWGRTGVVIVLASLVLSILLPATALAADGGYRDEGPPGYGPGESYGGKYEMGGGMGYPGQAQYGNQGYGPRRDDDNDNGNGAHYYYYDDDFNKTIYARDDYYSGQAQYGDQGYGPVDGRGGEYMMGSDMGYPGQDHYGDQGYAPGESYGGKYKMGGDMGYPCQDRDDDDDNGDDNGNGARCHDDDFHKTIYPRDDYYSGQAHNDQQGYGPVKDRGGEYMMGGDMGYPGQDRGGKYKKSYGNDYCGANRNGPHQMDDDMGMGGGAWWVCD